jgi:2-amino-4-hydroxy-6-hydroxymethyldihydropteridine diphosphokinase
MVDCYVGIGGNFAGTFAAIERVAFQLRNTEGMEKLILSPIYRTTPVSRVEQSFYLNAVCRFQTHLSVHSLWYLLQALEIRLGKKKKPKESPRLIDLDLLFYGSLVATTEEWTIPHPRWQERLFVLVPLADVTDALPIPDAPSPAELLKSFTNPYNEKVVLYDASSKN